MELMKVFSGDGRFHISTDVNLSRSF